METGSGRFAQTLPQQERLQQTVQLPLGTLNLTEPGGLGWELGVGLISIATRNSPRRGAGSASRWRSKEQASLKDPVKMTWPEIAHVHITQA